MPSIAKSSGLKAPKTLIEKVYHQLRRDIIEGRHAPGAKLRVEHLKELYGVGGGTIREALTLLLSDSLVTALGQRGFRVSVISPQDFADISNTRVLIEVEGLRQSFAHGDESWEAKVVAAFHRLSRAEESLSRPDSAAISNWEARNYEFHDALLSACPSKWIKQFASILYRQSERYRHLMLASLDPNSAMAKVEWPKQKKEHAEIFDAVLSRDVERAASLLAEHIRAPLHDMQLLSSFIADA